LPAHAPSSVRHSTRVALLIGTFLVVFCGRHMLAQAGDALAGPDLKSGREVLVLVKELAAGEALGTVHTTSFSDRGGMEAQPAEEKLRSRAESVMRALRSIAAYFCINEVGDQCRQDVIEELENLSARVVWQGEPGAVNVMVNNLIAQLVAGLTFQSLAQKDLDVQRLSTVVRGFSLEKCYDTGTLERILKEESGFTPRRAHKWGHEILSEFILSLLPSSQSANATEAPPIGLMQMAQMSMRQPLKGAGGSGVAAFRPADFACEVSLSVYLNGLARVAVEFRRTRMVRGNVWTELESATRSTLGPWGEFLLTKPADQPFGRLRDLLRSLSEHTSARGLLILNGVAPERDPIRVPEGIEK